MWRKVDDGWVLLLESDVPDQESTLLVKDSYLKIFVEAHKKIVSYAVSIDKRRTPRVLEDQKWIVLFFGYSPQIQPKVQGVKLWRDKCIVVERFGELPRMYCLVAR
jgi:hypothetical protein